VRRAAFLLVVAVIAAGCSALNDRVTQPGSAAKDIVSTKYANLRVELDYPSGSEPNAQAVAELKAALQEVTGRDDAHVTIAQSPDIPAEPNRAYSISDIQALENAHRSSHTGGDTVSVYVVYVAGSSTDDSGSSKVLGVAYHGTSLAMFKGNIRANTAPDGSILTQKPQENFVERAVLVHEFGHAMGLVNLGTPMVRDHEDRVNDPARHGHSSNAQSVMYYAVETTGGLATIVNCVTGQCGADIPYRYDADDKADLRALRGG
jgi:hypothetical protein